jgi:hypothetical protein
MNFIAAVLLRVVDNESAFWLLAIIIERVLTGHHSRDMGGGIIDTRVFNDLLDHHVPDIKRHLALVTLDPALICTRWFIPMFLHALPLDKVLQVWDLVLAMFSVYPEDSALPLFSLGVVILGLASAQILEARSAGDALQVCFLLRSLYLSLSHRHSSHMYPLYSHPCFIRLLDEQNRS